MLGLGKLFVFDEKYLKSKFWGENVAKSKCWDLEEFSKLGLGEIFSRPNVGTWKNFRAGTWKNFQTRGWIVIQKASQFTLQVFHNLNLGTCEA